MKVRIASLSLLALCLTLAAVPAMADIYNNGPIDGNTDAWTINSGFEVSDSFTTSGGSVTGLQFGAWLLPGDTLTSAEVSITSQEFGGTTFFDGTVNFSASNCVGNSLGATVCTETGAFNTTLAAGTYWLNLQNASVPSGDPVYWDENSGPSAASQSSVGTIPSESFTVLGGATTSTTTTGTGTTPEPSSIMLFGSGILGLAGMVRRRFF
jgi:hypothetical protein